MRIIAVILFIGYSFHSNAQQNQYFPPLLGEWETLSIDSLNWCQERVDEMVDFAEAQSSKSLIILKDGKIVVEEYFDGHGQDSLWYWASAGKTLVAFLIGKVQEDGFLNINDPVSNYLGAGWTSLTPEEEDEITVWNQLTMTSGLDDSNFDCTDPECLTFLEEPGERWAYHNGSYTLTQDVLANATGQGINAYLLQNLTLTTGITGAYVGTGYNSIMLSNSRSFARFGHLLLNEGNWNGIDIMGDADFFEEMTSPSQSLNSSYGYLTWLNGQESFILPGFQQQISGTLMPNAPSDMFMALGKNDQIINVVPSQGLVVIRMGSSANDDLVATSFNDELWEYINNLECENSVLETNLEVKLYPNPTSSSVKIESYFPVKYSIRNHLGQELKSGFDQKELDVSDLNKGIYFITLSANNLSITEKLVVE